MTTPDAAAVETRPITFHGREIQTVEPTKEQIAVIVRFSRLRPGAEVSVQRQAANINRLPMLVSALFADPEDWEWVEDGLTENRVKWEEVIDLLADATRVWLRDPDEPVDEPNRTSRRRKPAKAIEGTARRTT